MAFRTCTSHLHGTPQPQLSFYSIVRFARVTTLAFLASILVNHAISAPSPGPIHIGLLLPPEESEATSVRQGAALAVALASRTSSVPVNLVIRGRSGQWGDDGIEAGRLVLDDAVIGLIAPPGGAPTHLALQVAGRTATPVVSLCSDRSVTGAGVPWAIQIVPDTIAEALALFRHFPSHRRWAAIVPPDRTGRQIVHDLTDAASTANCPLDTSLLVPFDNTKPLILPPRWTQSPPDGVLIWLDSVPAAQAIHQLRALGYHGPMAGPGRLLTPSFINSAGHTLRGFCLTRPIPTPSSALLAAEFASHYRQTYGVPPDPIAAFAADAVSLLLHLHHHPGPLHHRFPVTLPLTGITGPFQFDNYGARQLPLEIHGIPWGQISIFDN